MNKEKVVLGISGGVDSSVAAMLLQQQGYEVIGFFMNCNVSGKSDLPSTIEWDKEEEIVRAICFKLGIKLHMADCELGYKKKVIDPMIRDYKMGLTPNPDTLCNKLGKFPKMIELAEKVGASKIATGHYVRVRKGELGWELLRGVDDEKDQSYFLCDLNQKILRKCLFPIGGFTKSEVRAIAKKAGFLNWEKRSSRGICYLGKIDLKEFLKENIPEKKGKILDSGGMIIGEHPGSWYYTIGERVRENKGLRMFKEYIRKHSREKLYVAEKRKGNVLVVVPENDKLLKRKKVWIHKFKLINNKDFPKDGLKARIRHLGDLIPGKIKNIDKGWIFEFGSGQEGVAPGQYIVIYKNERMIGNGEMRLG